MRKLVSILTLALALGCGNAWQQAMGDTIQKEAADLRAMVQNVQPSAEADQVSRVIDALEAEAYSGRIGAMDLAELRVKVEDAVYDGAIDAKEASEVQSAWDGMMKD